MVVLSLLLIGSHYPYSQTRVPLVVAAVGGKSVCGGVFKNGASVEGGGEGGEEEEGKKCVGGFENVEDVERDEGGIFESSRVVAWEIVDAGVGAVSVAGT